MNGMCPPSRCHAEECHSAENPPCLSWSSLLLPALQPRDYGRMCGSARSVACSHALLSLSHLR